MFPFVHSSSTLEGLAHGFTFLDLGRALVNSSPLSVKMCVI